MSRLPFRSMKEWGEVIRGMGGLMKPVFGRSEQELLDALQSFINGTYSLRIPAQSNDPDLMIGDAIIELMQLRAWQARAKPIVEDYSQQVDHQASCDYWRWDIPGGHCNCLKTVARALLAEE